MAINLLEFVPRRERSSTGCRGRAAGRPHRSWSRRTVAGLLVVLVALSAVGSAMAQGRRVALVVGNDAYTDQSVLRNAVNDARAVASALGEVGFAVTRVENADRARLTSALSAFAGSLRGDDVALFYFAGHGVQVDQENYLMPTDYAGRSSSALRFDAVSASDVQEMLGRARVAMLVFDACRNNPYRGVRGGRGLAPMEARGTLIAYAAGAGQVASDGPGASNGLFTSKLVEALRAPGLTAADLFRRVRRDVYEASNGEQWPAVYDDLLSDFVFRRAAAAGVAPPVGAPSAGATAAVEAALGLDRAARRRIQRGLAAAGFDPGPADGVFGRATRTAIRRWQAARGAMSTGYLDGAAAAALGASAGSVASAGDGGPASTQLQQETVFWETIRASTDPADFEAYLELFANGTFSRLARNRLAALRRPGTVSRPSSDPPRRRRPGDVFRDCAECPEMVVLPGGGLAMGRYEVTVGEYRVFVSATGRVADWCSTIGDGEGDSWRNPGFPQTDRHPVTCVNWNDAQAYVSWLSRRTGATYRLPTEAEWERAAAGSQPGCDRLGRGTRPDGTCPVGTNGTNAAGLSDMIGNVWEFTSACGEGDCSVRIRRGGTWLSGSVYLRAGARSSSPVGLWINLDGFRVSRTLD